jgi:hypothetical protein
VGAVFFIHRAVGDQQGVAGLAVHQGRFEGVESAATDFVNGCGMGGL